MLVGGRCMYRHLDWAMPVDTFILQFLGEIEYRGVSIIAPPKTIARHINYSRKHVADRCLVLTEHGLVRRVDGAPEYQITDAGRIALERPADYADGPSTSS